MEDDDPPLYLDVVDSLPYRQFSEYLSQPATFPLIQKTTQSMKRSQTTIQTLKDGFSEQLHLIYLQ